jgi:transposase
LWPSPVDGAVTITSAQLGYLLEGIDRRMSQKKTWRPTSVG